MAINQLIPDAEKMIELSEKFVKLSKFQAKHDHPKMASECFVTAKTLLYWGKMIVEAKKRCQ